MFSKGGALRLSRFIPAEDNRDGDGERGAGQEGVANETSALLFRDPLAPGGMLRMSRFVPSQSSTHGETESADSGDPVAQPGLAEKATKSKEWASKVSKLQSLVLSDASRSDGLHRADGNARRAASTGEAFRPSLEASAQPQNDPRHSVRAQHVMRDLEMALSGLVCQSSSALLPPSLAAGKQHSHPQMTDYFISGLSEQAEPVRAPSPTNDAPIKSPLGN